MVRDRGKIPNGLIGMIHMTGYYYMDFGYDMREPMGGYVFPLSR